MTTKPIAWYADRYADKYGFAIVPLKPNSKLPIRNDWGNETLDADTAHDYYTQSPDHNIGLALGPSRMCSLDIDCEESWALCMEEFGIPADSLDSYPTIKGKGKRLLFRVPEDTALSYAKLNWPRQDDPKRHFTVVELRISSGDKQRFDVLPPSIHPDTQEPYTWLVQPPRNAEDWPTPPNWLLAIWEAWDCFKPQLRDACPWSVKPEPPKAATAPAASYDGDSPIQVYLSNNTLLEALRGYGYKQVGKRYLSPHSGTGLPGVTVFPGDQSCWIHHASDPLCSEESGKPVNAFDLYCYYEHNGDISAACRRIVEVYGLKPPKPARDNAAIPAVVDELPAAEPTERGDSKPFKALGYNGAYYYYLPRGTEQVVEIKRGAHTSPAELMSLASLEWWEAHFPKESKNASGADWQAASSAMMRSCERAGIYTPERERGRGAWHDDGRAVLHMGDCLLVDGVRTAISDHASRFIYARAGSVSAGIDSNPATREDGAAVRAVIQRLAWVKPIHADLMAGWCALAPICGALSWRPHVWLTAQRGAGKSWVQDRIVEPLIGPMAMMVQGSTTEAGIRQRVGHDARSIVFDEAEAENQNGQRRIQMIMELARQSSSDSSAEIIKGTATGAAMAFRMRSMFFMGSINVAISQAADESRFSVLQLSKPQMTAEAFNSFERHVDGLLSDDFCGSLRSRIYRMIPVVRDTARVLADSIAEVLGSQRMGDQIGTLLAGCWCLEHDQAITAQQAADWVATLDFSDAEEAEQVSDEYMCLHAILQSQVRFDGLSGTLTRSVGELLDSVANGQGVDSGIASEALGRHGVRYHDGAVLISNSHSAIKKMLQETAWASGWRRMLARIPGSEAIGPTRFAGSTTRAVSVPYSELQ